MYEFTLSDVFIIGFFTSMIGFRKYPISKLDEMIKNNVIDQFQIRAILVYLIISAIGGLAVMGIILNNIFLVMNVNSANPFSKYSLLKTAVIVILSAIWSFSALNPVLERLTILERK